MYQADILFQKVNFEKISTKYAKAYSARKYVQFHGLGSQLAVIREEWGILKREGGGLVPGFRAAVNMGRSMEQTRKHGMT